VRIPFIALRFFRGLRSREAAIRMRAKGNLYGRGEGEWGEGDGRRARGEYGGRGDGGGRRRHPSFFSFPARAAEKVGSLARLARRPRPPRATPGTHTHTRWLARLPLPRLLSSLARTHATKFRTPLEASANERYSGRIWLRQTTSPLSPRAEVTLSGIAGAHVKPHLLCAL